MNLFGSHICYGAYDILRVLVTRTLRYRSDAEVTQHDLLLSAQQHIFWLDIAVDHPLLMRIVQSVSNLADIGHDGSNGQLCAFSVTLAQRSIRRIVHYQERHPLLDVKIEDAHDMWVYQARNGTRLIAEMFNVLARQLRMQHFHRGRAAQLHIFSQVHLRETSSPQQTHKAIVTKLLSYAVSHTNRPSSASIKLSSKWMQCNSTVGSMRQL